MTFFKVNPEDTISFTVIAEPKRKFIQNVGSFSGGVSLYNRRDQIEKVKPSTFTDLTMPVDTHDGEDLSSVRVYFANEYLKAINALPNASSKKFTIKRYTPNTTLSTDEIKRRFGNLTSWGQPTTDYLINYFDESSQKKWIIQDLLEPFHFSERDWSYPNYHCLNFYEETCLLYPNKDGRYNLGDVFTIDFRIKIPHKDFVEGIVIQSPENFTISAFPTEFNSDGDVISFGIKSKIKEETFLSTGLSLNKWHRVSISINKTLFRLYVDNALIRTDTLEEDFVYSNSSVLSVGADLTESNIDYKDLFKSGYCSPRGIPYLLDDPDDSSEYPQEITRYLNAEIHNLFIIKVEISHQDLLKSNKSLKDFFTINRQNIVFFLGPYFVPFSSIKKVNNVNADDISGVLTSPFGDVLPGVLIGPFNLNLSFGCAGHLINVENFVGDVSHNFDSPRMIGLTAKSTLRDNTNKLCDDYLSNQSKRNLFILPCDDGGFSPGLIDDLVEKKVDLAFDLIQSGYYLSANLTNIKSIFGSPPVPGLFGKDSGDSIFEGSSKYIQYKQSLENIESNNIDDWIEAQKNSPFVLFQNFEDSTSNQVVIFEISNLFYGKRIKPGTFTIRDHQLKGSTSTNPISITLKDDGKGNIYRADCTGNHSSTNIVGRIFYSEGLLIIKNPHLYFFGSGGFEVEFKGEQNIHTLKIEVVASQNSLNSSTNDPDQELLPSSDPSDKDSKFVWISGINFHDKDYNIVAKTQLAQPIVKRHEDRIMFRVQMDF